MTAASTVSHRDILVIAIPAIVANIAGPMLGLVDSWIAGHAADPDMLAALSIANTGFASLYMVLNFLRMATTGLTAQGDGRGDGGDANVFARASVIALALGLLILLAQGPIRDVMVAVLSPPASLKDDAASYLEIRIWGAPFALMNMVITGWLIGKRRAGAALALAAGMNLVNAGLNLWLARGLGLGLDGIAMGTLVAETSGALAGLRLVARLGAIPRKLKAVLSDVTEMAALLRLNRDLFLRTLSLMAAFALMTRWSASFGNDTLAANQLLMNFFFMTALILDGFAHATEAHVGAAVGARDGAHYARVVWLSTLWCAGTGAALAVAFIGLGELWVSSLTLHNAVQRAAQPVLYLAALVPFTGLWCFLADGILVGATRPKPMVASMAVSLALFVVSALILMESLGNTGLWIAFNGFLLVRALTLAPALKTLKAELKA